MLGIQPTGRLQRGHGPLVLMVTALLACSGIAENAAAQRPGTIITLANTWYGSDIRDGGPATLASLFAPTAVVVDPAGNLYIVDSHDGRVRKVDAGGQITTIAGPLANLSGI